MKLNSKNKFILFSYHLAKRFYHSLRIGHSKFKRMGRFSAVIGDEFRSNFAQAQKEFHRNPHTMVDFLKNHSLYDFWLYYVDSKDGPHYRMPWGENLMTKFPMDVWIYKTLIELSKPNLIIEIGTQRGNSTQLLKELSTKFNSIVVTFDILKPPPNSLSQFKDQGIHFFNVDATTETAKEKILSLDIPEKNIRALVIDDGSHDENHVIKSFNLFKDFIPHEGFYVIEDGFTNELLEKKSLLAMQGVREILNTSAEFKLYRSFDDFFVSSAYMGILQKKIK